MNAEIKAQWIAALSSGKYKQTASILHNKLGFCCLGVLCDIKDSNWTKQLHSPNFYYGNTFELSVLPPTVQEWSGIYNKTGGIDLVNRDDDQETLASLNDSGFTFDQIADVIQHFL
jgi:hypothetical protein